MSITLEHHCLLVISIASTMELKMGDQCTKCQTGEYLRKKLMKNGTPKASRISGNRQLVDVMEITSKQ